MRAVLPDASPLLGCAHCRLHRSAASRDCRPQAGRYRRRLRGHPYSAKCQSGRQDRGWRTIYPDSFRAAAARVPPVCPDQARVGMDADLFPDLRARGSRTSHGVLLGKSFAKTMHRSVLKKKNPGLSFHSWRHAANTKMASASDAVREQILGHEGERMTIKQALQLVKWDTVHLVPPRWNNWTPPSPATFRSPRSKRPA